MHVSLEIENQVEYQLLLQYVHLLKSARVVDSAPLAKPKKAEKQSFFERHFGSVGSQMSAEHIENQLKNLRDEWERPTW